nr:hypothetical protein [Tanacetum cinerariifolium]
MAAQALQQTRVETRRSAQRPVVLIVQLRRQAFAHTAIGDEPQRLFDDALPGLTLRTEGIAHVASSSTYTAFARRRCQCCQANAPPSPSVHTSKRPNIQRARGRSSSSSQRPIKLARRGGLLATARPPGATALIAVTDTPSTGRAARHLRGPTWLRRSVSRRPPRSAGRCPVPCAKPGCRRATAPRPLHWLRARSACWRNRKSAWHRAPPSAFRWNSRTSAPANGRFDRPVARRLFSAPHRCWQRSARCRTFGAFGKTARAVDKTVQAFHQPFTDLVGAGALGHALGAAGHVLEQVLRGLNIQGPARRRHGRRRRCCKTGSHGRDLFFVIFGGLGFVQHFLRLGHDDELPANGHRLSDQGFGELVVAHLALGFVHRRVEFHFGRGGRAGGAVDWADGHGSAP